jgi:uncharacterized membrane protein
MILLSIIKSNDNLAIWAVVVAVAALAIVLEHSFTWAAKITGCVIAMGIAILLSNIGFIPTQSPVYDNVWGYVVPLAIPMLLFKANIKQIWKESGRLVVIFLLSSLGTLAGAIIGYFLLKQYIPELYKVAAMMAGSYIGGSVNFVAMADAFKTSAQTTSAAVISDNLLMALYFFVLIVIPSMNFFLKRFTHPLIDKQKLEGGNENEAAAFWKGRDISLKDIALSLAISFLILWISTVVADYFSVIFAGSGILNSVMGGLFGNKYLVMTTITMLLATYIPNFFNNMGGAQEIGTFFIYIFFVVIGVPASVQLILEKSPLLLVYCAIMVLMNLLFTLVLGKLFKFDLEEIILASNANIGGPTTAAAMAIAKGWTTLVLPIILVGILGYIIGNYAGLFIGNFLMFQ